MTVTNIIKVNTALLGAVILWSSAFVAIRIGLLGFSPGSLALFRFGVASLCFIWPVIKAKPFPRLGSQHVISMLLIGAIGIAGYSILLNSGEQSLSSGLASFLVTQTPVITAILAIFWLKEKPSLNSIAGIGVSFLGVWIIVYNQHLEISSHWGVLLVLLATFCGSLQSILQKQMLKIMTPLQVTALSTWIASLMLIIFLPKLWHEAQQASASSIGAALFLGLVPSTLGQWLWSYGLSKTMVVKASTYLYAMPLISTVFGWLILSELPHYEALIGGLIALLGAMIVNKDAIKLANA